MVLTVPQEVLCKDLKNRRMPLSLFASCFMYSHMHDSPDDAKGLSFGSHSCFLSQVALAWTAKIYNLRHTIPSVLACCTCCNIGSCAIVAVLDLHSHLSSFRRDILSLFSLQSLNSERRTGVVDKLLSQERIAVNYSKGISQASVDGHTAYSTCSVCQRTSYFWYVKQGDLLLPPPLPPLPCFVPVSAECERLLASNWHLVCQATWLSLSLSLWSTLRRSSETFCVALQSASPFTELKRTGFFDFNHTVTPNTFPSMKRAQWYLAWGF